jgi:hypothetical protein
MGSTLLAAKSRSSRWSPRLDRTLHSCYYSISTNASMRSRTGVNLQTVRDPCIVRLLYYSRVDAHHRTVGAHDYHFAGE